MRTFAQYTNGDTAILLNNDPVWLSIIKIVVVFVFLMVMAMICVWGERRILGKMQHRPGPNRVGPFGLLQALADGLKVAFKEDIRPFLADKFVYMIAPVIAAVPAFLAFAVTPFGGQVSMFGHQTALQITDLPVGILLVLACSSVGIYGIVLGGWSSGSPYPLLSALRSAAQMISYEIAMGLSLVAVIIFSHSLSTADIVNAQSSGWYAWMLPVSFVIYLISMVGETNRAPFDLPEAESELVGGYHTEYSSLKFVLFYIAEYINMVGVSAFATTLFLGGWHAPWPLTLWGGANSGWWGLLWFFIKLCLVIFCFMWARAALPRLRYDQFMRFGWKVLVPVNLLWIAAVVAVREVKSTYGFNSTTVLIIVGVVVVVAVVIAFAFDSGKQPDDGEITLTGGGHPIPPIDLVVPTKPAPRRPSAARRRAAERAAAEAAVTAGSSAGKETGDGDV
jgi:NADH-quinone oxidoreductase subunit H